VAVDVGYDRASDRCAAALIVWDARAGREAATLTRVQPSTFPYVPGLLSFREIPPLLPLFEALDEPPGLVICDGQGIAHPRRMGLASHLGLILDCPSLGWAKSRLIGEHDEPPMAAGAAAPLMDKGEQIGWALRSRAGCRVTYVSPGHRLSMAQSLEAARALMGRHRLCEPARQAHALTRRLLGA
jgi:deoxyribonuclease V